MGTGWAKKGATLLAARGLWLAAPTSRRQAVPVTKDALAGAGKIQPVGGVGLRAKRAMITKLDVEEIEE
jgi:hypothetical protein